MTQKELMMFKKMLNQEKSIILQSLSPILAPSPKTGDPEGGDVCDIASSDRERELRLRLSEREREKMRAVEEALDRIEDGTFGVCDECEAKIPIGRLKAMPFATVCVECKSKAEKQDKLLSTVSEGTFTGGGEMREIPREEEE